MQYMILIHSEPFDAPAPGDAGFDELMAPWMAYKNTLVDGSHFVAAEQLQGTETATTIRRVDGADTVVDGPFAETKEHLGGFYIVEATDLDEALALAAAVPIPAGSLEVRPVVPS